MSTYDMTFDQEQALLEQLFDQVPIDVDHGGDLPWVEEPEDDGEEVNPSVKAMFDKFYDEAPKDMPVELKVADMSRNPNAARLRRYWTRGEGAPKIGWGIAGDYKRCVRKLRKYVGGDAEGLCNHYHQVATGHAPGKGPHVGGKSFEQFVMVNKIIQEMRDGSLQGVKNLQSNMESKVRRVRTPAGVDWFDQPLGSIIIRDSILKSLTTVKTDYEGWEKYKGHDGKDYYSTQDDQGYLATDAAGKILVEADDEEELLKKLDAYVNRQPQVRKMTAKEKREYTERRKAKKGGGISTSDEVSTTGTRKIRSDYEDYDKYRTASGNEYYTYMDDHGAISVWDGDDLVADVNSLQQAKEEMTKADIRKKTRAEIDRRRNEKWQDTVTETQQKEIDALDDEARKVYEGLREKEYTHAGAMVQANRDVKKRGAGEKKPAVKKPNIYLSVAGMSDTVNVTGSKGSVSFIKNKSRPDAKWKTRGGDAYRDLSNQFTDINDLLDAIYEVEGMKRPTGLKVSVGDRVVEKRGDREPRAGKVIAIGKDGVIAVHMDGAYREDHLPEDLELEGASGSVNERDKKINDTIKRHQDVIDSLNAGQREQYRSLTDNQKKAYTNARLDGLNHQGALRLAAPRRDWGSDKGGKETQPKKPADTSGEKRSGNWSQKGPSSGKPGSTVNKFDSLKPDEEVSITGMFTASNDGPANYVGKDKHGGHTFKQAATGKVFTMLANANDSVTVQRGWNDHVRGQVEGGGSTPKAGDATPESVKARLDKQIEDAKKGDYPFEDRWAKDIDNVVKNISNYTDADLQEVMDKISRMYLEHVAFMARKNVDTDTGTLRSINKALRDAAYRLERAAEANGKKPPKAKVVRRR